MNNNNTNQITDSLHHELERNVSELEKSAPKREENRLKLIFLHIFDGISSSGEAIEQLMKATKGRTRSEKCPLHQGRQRYVSSMFIVTIFCCP